MITILILFFAANINGAATRDGKIRNSNDDYPDDWRTQNPWEIAGTTMTVMRTQCPWEVAGTTHQLRKKTRRASLKSPERSSLQYQNNARRKHVFFLRGEEIPNKDELMTKTNKDICGNRWLSGIQGVILSFKPFSGELQAQQFQGTFSRFIKRVGSAVPADRNLQRFVFCTWHLGFLFSRNHEK